MPFALKIATRDWHPANHVSFASQHANAQPFSSFYENTNFENPDEVVTSRLWPDHCIQGTKGSEIISELNRSKLSHVVDKGQDPRVESYSAFGPPFKDPPVCRTELSCLLDDAGVEYVVVVGLAFDYCVKDTALDAAKQGYKVLVVDEACKAVDQTENGLGMSRLEYKNAGVKVVGMECQELQLLRMGGE